MTTQNTNQMTAPERLQYEFETSLPNMRPTQLRDTIAACKHEIASALTPRYRVAVASKRLEQAQAEMKRRDQQILNMVK